LSASNRTRVGLAAEELIPCPFDTFPIILHNRHQLADSLIRIREEPESAISKHGWHTANSIGQILNHRGVLSRFSLATLR
jgi:hypothetical protein